MRCGSRHCACRPLPFRGPVWMPLVYFVFSATHLTSTLSIRTNRSSLRVAAPKVESTNRQRARVNTTRTSKGNWALCSVKLPSPAPGHLHTPAFPAVARDRSIALLSSPLGIAGVLWPRLVPFPTATCSYCGYDSYSTPTAGPGFQFFLRVFPIGSLHGVPRRCFVGTQVDIVRGLSETAWMERKEVPHTIDFQD